jgi:hypothetical protein
MTKRRLIGAAAGLWHPLVPGRSRRASGRCRARLFVALALAAAALSAPAAIAACTKLPPAVPDRIGRAILSLSKIPDKSVLAGKYDLIWADYFYKPQWAKVPGIYAMKYMTAYRDPNPNAKVPNPTAANTFTATRDLHWYHVNHPDWVQYKCPGAPEPPMCSRPAVDNGPNNPAYACFYPYSADFVPLDITNPEVRQFLFDSNLGSPPLAPPMRGFPPGAARQMSFPSVLASGLYEAVAVDNINAENGFGACGIYHGNNFVQQYSGAAVDPRYTAAKVAWVEWLRQRVNAAGLCLAGNDYFTTGYPQGFMQLADALDIVLDEHGFTRNPGPLETGAAWRTRTDTLQRLAATGKPLIIVDIVDAEPRQQMMRGPKAPQIAWSLANYLLIKGDHTYLALNSDHPAPNPAENFPELFIPVGRPTGAMQTNGTIYWRSFEHALAAVNPSRGAGRLNLGATRWYGLDGRSFSGSVAMPPASAVVLTDRAP